MRHRIRAADDQNGAATWRRIVFQTSINAPCQKTPAIAKQACQKAGIDMELKSVTPSIYLKIAETWGRDTKKLRETLSGWDSTFWNLKDWYREG